MDHGIRDIDGRDTALRARTLHMRPLRRLTVLAAGAAVAIAGFVALPQPARAASGPFLYLADYRNNAVDVIDASDGAGVATIPVGTWPSEVVLSPAGTQAWVVNSGSDSISVIDTGSNTVTATIPLSAYQPVGIALNHDGTMAYVTTNPGAVVAISTSTDTVAATIPLGFSDVGGMALNPAGTVAYVADGVDAALAVVDLSTGAVTASVPTGASGGPISVAVSPDGSRVYVLNYSNADSTVSVFDTSTNTLAAVIPAGSQAGNFALNPAGTLIYVVALQGDISVIDATTETLTGTIPLGESSGGVAFGADGAVAYAGIAYQGGNPDASLAVIDTATGAVTATISLGGNQSVTSIAVTSPGPGIDQSVTTTGTGTVTTPAFNTIGADETLLAFVGSDGPFGAHKQTVTVSGAGLTWTLVRRANAQAGDAEIWQATAPSVLTGVTVTSKQAKRGYDQDLSVVVVQGTGGVGAAKAASAVSGAPALSLTTTGDNSLVFAVGDDWDNAVRRTLPAGWTLLNQWLDTATADTYWSQYTSTPIAQAGTVVTVGDTAPTVDRWNLAAVEVTSTG